MPVIETKEDLLSHYAAVKKRMYDAGKKYAPEPAREKKIVKTVIPEKAKEEHPVRVETRKYSPDEIRKFLIQSKDPLATAIEFSEQIKVRIWWTDIANMVCLHFNHDYNIIFGLNRVQELAGARQLSWALAKEFCPHLSLTAIGRLCDRDHSTIIHGIRRGAEHPLYEDFRARLQAKLEAEIAAVRQKV